MKRKRSSDDFEPLTDATEITAVDGALTLSDGAIGQQYGTAIIDIDVAGNVTIPAAILEQDNDVTFTVGGTLIAGVRDDGAISGDGVLTGVGDGAVLDLETFIFAR